MSINELDTARAASAADVMTVVEQTERIEELEQELHDLRNEMTWKLGHYQVEAAAWQAAALCLRDEVRAWKEAAEDYVTEYGAPPRADLARAQATIKAQGCALHNWRRLVAALMTIEQKGENDDATTD